jgi:DNA-binding XRE family transcriptional regulator
MQNSDAENEYMKSMLPKQKSYVPRFALLINALWSFDGDTSDYFYGVLNADAMLKAEKLSDYFINMSKKVKIESQEKSDLKSIMYSDKSKTKFDKFKSLYKANKELNKSQVAELLNVSRVSINKWINKIDNENSKLT